MVSARPYARARPSTVSRENSRWASEAVIERASSSGVTPSAWMRRISARMPRSTASWSALSSCAVTPSAPAPWSAPYQPLIPETSRAFSRSAWFSRELREPPRMWLSTSTAGMSGSPSGGASHARPSCVCRSGRSTERTRTPSSGTGAGSA